MTERIEFISFEDFQKLFKAEKEKEMRLVLLLGFGSGLRISEIVGLEKWFSKCCDIEVAQISVKQGEKESKKFFCVKCERKLNIKDMKRKKGQWEIMPLTADKINLETHQIRIDNAKGGKWRVTIAPPNLTADYLKLFPLNIPRRTIQYRFGELTKKVLNKKMNIHILRHGFGNYQANVLKLPLPIIQQMMGHSRLETTGIYTKVNPEYAIKEAWKAMGGK